jgi:hypothetical protein
MKATAEKININPKKIKRVNYPLQHTTFPFESADGKLLMKFPYDIPQSTNNYNSVEENVSSILSPE